MTRTITTWQTIESDTSPMRLFVVRVDDTKPAPYIIVLQEAFGLNAHIRNVTERIAGLGYNAVAPDLFHRTAAAFEGDYNDISKSKPHMDALTNDRLEVDIRTTYDWIKKESQADTHSIATVGFCLGGKAAFIAGATLPLKAAVSYYGSGIPALLSSYTASQKAPLLLIWGGKDNHIDAEKRAEVAGTLRAESKAFTQIEFSEAGHGFFCEERKSYHADAARESWAILTAFLKNALLPVIGGYSGG